MMKKEIYPDIIQLIGLVLLMAVGGVAGYAGYIPGLLWKNSLTENIGDSVAYIGSLGVPIWYAARRIRQNGERFSFREKFSGRVDIHIVALLAVTTVALAIAIDYFVHLFNLKDLLSDKIDQLIKTPVFAFVSLAILPAILEELLVRGVIMGQFLKKYSAHIAILYSALFFGLIHLNPPQILAGFLSGCFLGWIYYRTKNLIYCILIHFVNNGLSWFGLMIDKKMPASLLTKYMNSMDTNTLAFTIAAVVIIAGVYLLNRYMPENFSKLPEHPDLQDSSIPF